MDSQRSFAAILFTDIVGSTQRAAEMGNDRWRELLDRHHALVRRWLRLYGGNEIKTAGDGFLAIFENPARALACADAIRNAVRDLDLGVRCGAHVGEVERKDGDVGGLAVHIGARVAALGESGEVLVSSTVHDGVVGSGFRFEDRGRHELKGVPGQWRIYALTGVPEEARAALLERAAAEGPRGAWSRLKDSRFVRALLVYLVLAGLVLYAARLAVESYGLPGWAMPVAVLLLVVGFAVIAGTAWVQSHPLTPIRSAAGEVPGPSAVDVRGLLRALRSGRLPYPTWGRAILGGLIAFSLLFGAAGLYVVIQDRGRTFSPADAVAEGAAPGIAVLPFTVNGPGLDVWREGVIDLVSTNIDGAGGLRAIDARTVLARWGEVVQGSATPDLETALEIGRRTGARYALLGTATALGADIRLVADIYDLTNGRSLGRTQVQGVPDSVYALVDRLSIGVLETVLAGKSEALPQVNLARVTTTSLPALKAYLEGEALYRRSDFDAAIPVFQRAVEADSTFALAHYRLALAYGWQERLGSDLAIQYGEQAARYADRLPERDAILIRAALALDRGTLDGIDPLRQGVRKYPDDVELWYTLGETYFHFGSFEMVDDAQHDAPWERAIKLDPSLAPLYIHPTDVAFYRADSARATWFGRTYLRLAPTGQYAPAFRHALALLWGDEAARASARSTLDTLSTKDGLAMLLLLSHPRNLPLAAELADLLRRRPDWNDGSPNEYLLVYRRRGDLTSLLTTLDDPRTERRFRENSLFFLHMVGFPIPPERLVESAAFGPADTVPGLKPFLVAILAAEEGRWTDFERAAARAHRDTQRLRAEGDSIRLRTARVRIQVIDGYAAWRRGERDEARTLLEVARREPSGMGLLVNIWLGTLALEEGRLADAERYLETGLAWLDRPLVADRLGQVYEAMGEREKAREAYELFMTAWRDADPALQPRVEAARQALYRLGFGRRG